MFKKEFANLEGIAFSGENYGYEKYPFVRDPESQLASLPSMDYFQVASLASRLCVSATKEAVDWKLREVSELRNVMHSNKESLMGELVPLLLHVASKDAFKPNTLCTFNVNGYQLHALVDDHGHISDMLVWLYCHDYIPDSISVRCSSKSVETFDFCLEKCIELSIVGVESPMGGKCIAINMIPHLGTVPSALQRRALESWKLVLSLNGLKSLRLGKIDPYVIISRARQVPQESETVLLYRTKPMENVKDDSVILGDPIIIPYLHTLVLDPFSDRPEIPSVPLLIDLFDWENLRKDQHLGRAEISWSAVMEAISCVAASGSSEINFQFTTSDKKKNAKADSAASVTLSMTFFAAESVPAEKILVDLVEASKGGKKKHHHHHHKAKEAPPPQKKPSGDLSEQLGAIQCTLDLILSRVDKLEIDVEVLKRKISN